MEISRGKLIILIAVGIVVLAFILVLLGVLPGLKTQAPAAATLEFWGMKDDQQVWQDLIDEFQKTYPTISVNYKRLEEGSYENTLLNSLAEGKGPDIFMLKNSWVAKHKDKVYPLPQTALNFTTKDFNSTFVDGTVDDLILPDGNIVGLPLFVDTPVLLYNKDVFNTAGIALPPKTWDDVVKITQTLSRQSTSGDIINSGIALGAAKNINRYFEIISSLILQGGDPIINKQNQQIALEDNSQKVLDFYTSFADPRKDVYAWNASLPEAMDAFAQEKTDMIVVLAQDVPQVLAKNPHLNFGVMPFPQFQNSGTPVVYTSYFFPAVSKFSPNASAAWTFLSFAASNAGAQIYIKDTSRAPARRDLLAAGAPSDSLEVFYRQALIARSWEVPEEKGTKKIFQDAIEAVNSKLLDPQQAIGQIRDQLSSLLPQ